MTRSTASTAQTEARAIARRTAAWASLAGALAGAGALAACSSSSNGDGAGEVTDAAPDAATNDATMAAVVDAGSDAAPPPDAAPDVAPLDAGPCADPGAMPTDLACTGLYSDWATKTIAAGVVEYTPGLVFWSDGAVKTRWIYLPPNATIDTTDPDNWVFPVGTKIWKQFAVGGQVVETRLIAKGAANWSYLDYRWSADGTSAVRLDSGETNVNGTTYEIPATYVCTDCHGGRTDAVLGIDLLGLGLPGAQGITLASLAAQGAFTKAPAPLSITVPEDATGHAAAALGWLHVNCGSSCHNSLGKASGTRLYMKLLAGELYPDGGAGSVRGLDTYRTAVDVMANVTPGGAPYLRIAPGDAAHSLVPILAATRDGDAGFEPMPPIVSHIPDDAGISLLNAWIDGLGDGGADAH
jgi:hypothetical protein